MHYAVLSVDLSVPCITSSVSHSQPSATKGCVGEGGGGAGRGDRGTERRILDYIMTLPPQYTDYSFKKVSAGGFYIGG